MYTAPRDNKQWRKIQAAYEALSDEDRAEIDRLRDQLAEGIKDAAMTKGGKRPQVGPGTALEVLGAIGIAMARREAK